MPTDDPFNDPVILAQIRADVARIEAAWLEWGAEASTGNLHDKIVERLVALLDAHARGYLIAVNRRSQIPEFLTQLRNVGGLFIRWEREHGRLSNPYSEDRLREIAESSGKLTRLRITGPAERYAVALESEIEQTRIGVRKDAEQWVHENSALAFKIELQFESRYRHWEAIAIEQVQRRSDPLIQNHRFYEAMKDAHENRKVITEDSFRRLVVETLGLPENEITDAQWFDARLKFMKEYGAVEFVPSGTGGKDNAPMKPLRNSVSTPQTQPPGQVLYADQHQGTVRVDPTVEEPLIAPGDLFAAVAERVEEGRRQRDTNSETQKEAAPLSGSGDKPGLPGTLQGLLGARVPEFTRFREAVRNPDRADSGLKAIHALYGGLYPAAGEPITARLPEAAFLRMAAETATFLADYLPKLEREANKGGPIQDAELLRELVTNQFSLVARECMAVCTSVQEFEVQLRWDIAWFVCYGLIQYGWLRNPMARELDAGFTFFAMRAKPWVTDRQTGRGRMQAFSGRYADLAAVADRTDLQVGAITAEALSHLALKLEAEAWRHAANAGFPKPSHSGDTEPRSDESVQAAETSQGGGMTAGANRSAAGKALEEPLTELDERVEDGRRQREANADPQEEPTPVAGAEDHEPAKTTSPVRQPVPTLTDIKAALGSEDRKNAVRLRCILDPCTITELWRDAFKSRGGTDKTKRTAFNRWQVSRRDTPSWADELMRARLLR